MARKKITTVQLTAQANGMRLSSHEKICALRMKQLQDSIKELSAEVKSLRTDVAKGKGAISVLVFLGTMIAAAIGYFNYK